MIIVTTPTGQIGRQVLDRLLAARTEVRVIVRDPSRLSPDIVRQVDVVEGMHDDPATLERALTGAESVFWLVPPALFARPTLEEYVSFTRPAAERFAAKGVRRVVGISALGRGVPGPAGMVSAGLATDDLIGASGVAYRALTMPSFMDNLLRQVQSIRDEGVFRDVLSAEHRAPLVANRDIAEVATGLLLDESWAGVAERPLLGPEDLGPKDLAAIMSEVLDRPVHYEQTPVVALQSVSRWRYEMMAAKINGLDNHVTRTPETSSPTTFRQWCEEVLLPAVKA